MRAARGDAATRPDAAEEGGAAVIAIALVKFPFSVPRKIAPMFLQR